MMTIEFPQDAATWGRRRRSDWLREQGVTPDSPEWNAAHAAMIALADAAARESARKQAEREAARLAPWMPQAREHVLDWGCIEEMEPGEERDAAVERGVLEEADRLATEAEEAAVEAEAQREREEAALIEYAAKQACLRLAVAAATEAVLEAGWTISGRKCSHDSSRYFWLGSPLADGEDEPAHYLSLRISDHHAKNGAGWNEAEQTRHDEPNINIVIRPGAGGEYTFDIAPLVETLDQF
jgi:hypothetical protein